MKDVLDISEVARRTGISARALRFYEARGLVAPLRTASGRRLYGPGEMERIAQILALKKAGLTLAQIGRLRGGGAIDLARLVDAQLDAIAAQAASLEEARALLLSVRARLARGETIDAATFCTMIRNGDDVMQSEAWKTALERHYSPEELARWAGNPPPEGFDQAAYAKQWEALGARIDAALPLDPASAEAQAFVREWDALLAPFRAAATPEMMSGAQGFWDSGRAWQGDVKPPFSAAAWRFIAEARAAAGTG